MEFVIIDIETLKEIDEYWETRRKSNDGTKAIIHREIFDVLMPQVMTMNLAYDEEGNPIEEERKYPFPIATGEEINNMVEFKSMENGNKTIS